MKTVVVKHQRKKELIRLIVNVSDNNIPMRGSGNIGD